MSFSSQISDISAFSRLNQDKKSRLSLKEQNRLNEAAKIRVAKILGVERNMIDLTDEEPPRKMARLENNSRTGFRHSGSVANAPSPNSPAPNLQDIIRTQSISSPQNPSHNHTSSTSMDQTNIRKRSAPSLDRTYPSTDHLGRPASVSSHPASHRPHLSDQPPIPGTAIQGSTQGLVSYQAPNQINNSYASPQLVSSQGPSPPAANQHHSAYTSPQIYPTQHAMPPPPTDLAHPVDLLNNISLSVASLELFQLQQILSSAALRHPDVLEHLRTSSRIQETNRSTAHQALFDLLRAQSQGELRVARLQDERIRRGSAYTASPYGPPPHEVAGAPSYSAGPYGAPSPVSSAPPPYPPTAAASTQAHGPTSSQADFPHQTVGASSPIPRSSPNLEPLPSQVIDFHDTINKLSTIRILKSPTAILAALKSMCQAAYELVQDADTTVMTSLRKDTVFAKALWQVYNKTFERFPPRSRLSLGGLVQEFKMLDRARDGCFIGFADFLSAYEERSIAEWEACGPVLRRD